MQATYSLSVPVQHILRIGWPAQIVPGWHARQGKVDRPCFQARGFEPMLH
jgi:hypothetical protein